MQGLTAWQLVIVFLVLLIIAVLVCLLVVVFRAARKSTGSMENSSPSADVRLRQLDELRRQGLISDAEHAAKRAEILDGL